MSAGPRAKSLSYRVVAVRLEIARLGPTATKQDTIMTAPPGMILPRRSEKSCGIQVQFKMDPHFDAERFSGERRGRAIARYPSARPLGLAGLPWRGLRLCCEHTILESYDYLYEIIDTCCFGR